MTAAMMPAVSPVEKEGTSPIYNQGKDVAIYKYSFSVLFFLIANITCTQLTPLFLICILLYYYTIIICSITSVVLWLYKFTWKSKISFNFNCSVSTDGSHNEVVCCTLNEASQTYLYNLTRFYRRHSLALICQPRTVCTTLLSILNDTWLCTILLALQLLREHTHDFGTFLIKLYFN